MDSVLFLDTETTGVDTGESHVVELAAVLGAQRFESLYKPPTPIPPESSAVHNLTDEDVDGWCSIGDHPHEALSKMVAEAEAIAGHNITSFDLPILEREMPRFWPQIPIIDTLRLARHLWPDLPSHALQVLRYRFKLNAGSGDAHRAMFDAELCRALVNYALDTTDAPADARELAEFCAAPIAIKVMYFGKHKGEPVEKMPRDYVRWLASQPWLKGEHFDLWHTLRGVFGAQP